MATPQVAALAMSRFSDGLRAKVWQSMSQSLSLALAATYVSKKEPCEWYAATQKHGKYDVSFEGTDYFFGAMVFETLGAINRRRGEQLFRFAAKRLGREFTSYCGRAWARVSCNLQRSVSQAILSRIDGQEFRDVAQREFCVCFISELFI